jgi:hypothetical protein
MEVMITSEERKANKAKRKCIQRKGSLFASRCTISLPRKLEICSSSTNCMSTVSKSPLNQKIPQPIPQIINTHQPPNSQASSSPQKKASSSKSTSTTSSKNTSPNPCSSQSKNTPLPHSGNSAKSTTLSSVNIKFKKSHFPKNNHFPSKKFNRNLLLLKPTTPVKFNS